MPAGIDNGIDKTLGGICSAIEATSTLTTVSTQWVFFIGSGTVVDGTCSNTCLTAWDTATDMDSVEA